MSRESIKAMARQVVLHKCALPTYYDACVAALVSTERGEQLLIETRDALIAEGVKVPAGPPLTTMRKPRATRARRAVAA